ncbi:unnamed protein product [Ambrosiozyma monospora]|uniref:Unnamed protein product n=1 Tax=Ambrosiozyma monospora TaxID=43982 RepID=A0A9W6SUM7_AMBMO|nr:unnamed protein product [Ambrosiozyma monospora]
MVDLTFKYLPYKMSKIRMKKLLYLPVRKGGFGLMDLIQQLSKNVNNLVSNLALPGYATNYHLLSLPFYYLHLPNIQLPSYIDYSEFRNSARRLMENPSEYKFNVSYFKLNKAVKEVAERVRLGRNAVNPNEITVEYMLNRPNAWTEPALEEPNDQFVVKPLLPHASTITYCSNMSLVGFLLLILNIHLI